MADWTPESRVEEILFDTINGESYDGLPQSRIEELLLELKEVIEAGGGGGGGTNNYNILTNKPKIAGTILSGDKSLADLGIQGVLKSELKVSTSVGTAGGKTYPAGTNLETILRDILITYTPPTVQLTTTPSTRLYDIVTASVSSIMLKAAVTKKTDNVTKVSFYVGDTLVNEITTGVSIGGNFQYQYNPITPIKTDTTFKATATDGKQTSQSTFAIKFVGKSYYGICDASVSDPDETTIKSGSNTLKDTNKLTYNGITTSWGKVFYAYPKSFGALTYIKDEINNINYFDSFQRSEKNVDGIAYYVYTLIEPTAAVDNQLVFK